jgi:hypothetical protein
MLSLRARASMLRPRAGGAGGMVAAARMGARALSSKEPREPRFLSDALAKAAIGGHDRVLSSFASAFADVFHGSGAEVEGVTQLREVTGLSLAREMKNDIALRYSVKGGAPAMLEIIPPFSRTLVEIQQRSERYLAARSIAHLCGHYLGAIDDMARAIHSERKAQRALESREPAGSSKRRSSLPKTEYTSAVYTAYVRRGGPPAFAVRLFARIRH